jgi:phage terminase large subunit-like protein
MFLLPRFDAPVSTPAFHLKLWELATSPDPQVAIAAPRGHAKSTAITHTFTIACLCFREKDHALIVSDTEAQAVNFVQDIKREFEENEDLRQAFEFSGWVKEAEREIVGRWKDGTEFRILAAGSGQKLRGMKWRNKRPNLIIGDDLENDELVLSDERRAKFREWVFKALLPSGSKNCLIRFVGTILHLDSMLERLMPNEMDADTITTPLFIYSTNTERTWKSFKFRAHPSMNDFSAILWEEQYNEDRLRRIRRTYEEQGFPEGYGQEYLNNPVDDSIAFFKKADFIPIPDYAKVPNNQKAGAEPEEFYAAIDMAISTKDTRAYTVIVVCGLTPGGILRVRDVRRFRGDTLDIIEEMFAVQATWNPELFVVEHENIAASIGPVLTAEMMKPTRPFIRIQDETPHSQDKKKRARSIQYRHRARAIQYDFEADWFPDLQQEMMHFPRGKYMDQVDAMAWIGLTIDKMQDTPTWKELDDFAYEEEFERTMGSAEQGRNSYTGY